MWNDLQNDTRHKLEALRGEATRWRDVPQSSAHSRLARALRWLAPPWKRPSARRGHAH